MATKQTNLKTHGEITGEVLQIGETKMVGKGNNPLRQLVLNVTDEYFHAQVPIAFYKEAAYELDDVNVGDEVTVWFRLGGWNKTDNETSQIRYFPDIKGIKLMKHSGDLNETNETPEEVDDDLPF